ncbi:MAG: VanZ family protein [Limisphaerales bacterium]
MVQASNAPHRNGFWHRGFNLVLPLAWMGIIFLFSTDSFSGSRTSRLIGPLLHWLFPGSDAAFLDSLHFAIRKFGHLSEYAILAGLWYRSLGGGLFKPQWPSRKRALVAGTICLLFAMSDEWHQTMTHHRTGHLTDVALDTLGAWVTLACLHLKHSISERGI